MSYMRCKLIENPTNQDVGPLLDTFERWRRALVEEDIAALVDLVTEDAEFWTHGQPALKGRVPLREAWTPLFRDWQVDQELECDELMMTEDLAVVRGTEVNRLTPKKGGASLTRRQRAISILRRGADRQWRFARGMTNAPPEAEEEVPAPTPEPPATGA